MAGAGVIASFVGTSAGGGADSAAGLASIAGGGGSAEASGFAASGFGISGFGVSGLGASGAGAAAACSGLPSDFICRAIVSEVGGVISSDCLSGAASRFGVSAMAVRAGAGTASAVGNICIFARSDCWKATSIL